MHPSLDGPLGLGAPFLAAGPLGIGKGLIAAPAVATVSTQRTAINHAAPAARKLLLLLQMVLLHPSPSSTDSSLVTESSPTDSSLVTESSPMDSLPGLELLQLHWLLEMNCLEPLWVSESESSVLLHQSDLVLEKIFCKYLC
ncbi:hypothetical protein AVEN_100579-1 [Araneus ventricosus]|uniref:Uncharacterized protein n=1 Tax=Araneus ventricosus TaxID=182803 RepID=A0A4Y2FFK1_ARAVE|nr:hypothetical protein AVEN_100579-1 [Araneus ventricosus]